MRAIARVTRVGLALALSSLLLFAIPVWLANHCYYDQAFALIVAGIIIQMYFAFHPATLEFIGAVDVGLYLLSAVEDRQTKFRATVIRNYMRWVVLAIAIWSTSLMRQIVVMIFRNEDFSYVSLALPLYMIVMRKRVFGGKMEEYLFRYVLTSLLVVIVGSSLLTFVPDLAAGADRSCQWRRMNEKFRAAMAEKEARREWTAQNRRLLGSDGDRYVPVTKSRAAGALIPVRESRARMVSRFGEGPS
jgi:hypothetical protein